MNRATAFALLAACLSALPAPMVGQAAPSPDPSMARALPIFDSVWIEDLTWLEVRDLMKQGKRTVLIPTGGVEANGPYLVTAKHNIILKATMESIARRLGDALVAPIVAFVPEGDFFPKEPTGWMRWPGPVSVTEETYEALLTDIARSMKTHGFQHIVFLGESGGNQDGQKAVAAKLSKEWAGTGTDIVHVPEYYDNARLAAWIKQQGYNEVAEGHHDDMHYTAEMMFVDPQSVRAEERRGAGLFRINGVDLDPVSKTRDLGRRMVEYQTDYTVEAIQRYLNQKSTSAIR